MAWMANRHAVIQPLPNGSVRLTFHLVWVQDYGGEKSSGIGVDEYDVLLIEDAYGVSSPHPHSPRYATPCSSALSKK